MVRYGFIRTREEIKFLILTCLKYIPSYIEYVHVVDLCTWCDDGFSFFEFEECFRELEVTGHMVSRDGVNDKEYKITKLGADTADLFADNLPFTVKEAAEKSATRVMRQIRRDADIIANSYEVGENDIKVELGMRDVISISMSVTSEMQASILKKNFKKNAERIFQEVLQSLTSEE